MLRDASRLETSYRVGGALRAVSGAVVDVARRVATAFSPRASRDARVKCRPPAVGGDRKEVEKVSHARRLGQSRVCSPRFADASIFLSDIYPIHGLNHGSFRPTWVKVPTFKCGRREFSREPGSFCLFPYGQLV